MSSIVISVENLSKSYRLGQIGTGTLTNDLKVWWAKQRGKPNPLLKIGQEDHGSRDGEELWALRDVSFTVEQGEVLGIIGRNGAGKSTLLKILSRVTAPTSGQVKVRGRIASLLEVGTGFHPELTGRENIYLNGAILGMSREEVRRKFDEIVAFAEVEKFIDTPVKRYSSGMYVRLAFAVAAHLDPEILLVDEVLAVGDAAFQKKCLGKMGDVAKEGRTVLFVSHNMVAITSLCENVIWFDGGQICDHGEADSITNKYLSVAASQKPERKWNYPGNAPGDDRVRLTAVRVKQNGIANAHLNINLDSEIEIEFVALKDLENLICGISFYSADDTCIFAHCDWQRNRVSKGKYKRSMLIPCHFLAEGTVNVLAQLIFYEPSITSVVERNAISFDCYDSNDPMSVRGLYHGRWPGIVRPQFQWTSFCSLHE